MFDNHLNCRGECAEYLKNLMDVFLFIENRSVRVGAVLGDERRMSITFDATEPRSQGGGEPFNKFDNTTFDAHAELYEIMFATPYRSELEMPTLSRLLGDITGLNVLDYGCGTGHLCRWLRNHGAGEVTGYDVSEGMLDYAREHEVKTPLGISYSSPENTFEDNAFDIVLAVYVFPYALDKKTLISMARDMARALKPGGRLITLPLSPDVSVDPQYYKEHWFTLCVETPRVDGAHVDFKICHPRRTADIKAFYWSKETLEEVLKQEGFNSIVWEKFNRPAESSVNRDLLNHYLQTPHAGIIEAIKG